MRKTIEELWYGNIDPSVKCREITSETKELMEYMAKHHDDLLATLNDSQKELLEKFGDCYAEFTAINECRIFSYAFSLGAKLVIEAMETKFE